MKLLVTGSRGFIGSRLIQELHRLQIPFDCLVRNNWPDQLLELNLNSYTAVIHLATAAATQNADSEKLYRDNVVAIENFLQRIDETNPRCALIFISSQSAKSDTDSTYGKLKWQCEERLRKHSGPWTIIRPGLVLGIGSKGLGNRILGIIDRSPIVPLIGNGEQQLQLVTVDVVVDALIKVAQQPILHNKKEYALAGAPVSFREFLSQAARIKNRSIRFLPIPMIVVEWGLSILELLPNPPLTKTNLLGLLHSTPLDTAITEKALGVSFPSSEVTLNQALIAPAESEISLSEEGTYLHRMLFKKAPSADFLEQYSRAHQYCCFAKHPSQNIQMSRIISNKLDAEAIEFATRSRKTILTKKLHLMCYLAEVKGDYFSFFVNEEKNLLKGFFLLAAATLKAPWKFLKGKYLIRRHSLV